MCIIAIWSRRSEGGEGAQIEFRKILGEGDETTVAIIICAEIKPTAMKVHTRIIQALLRNLATSTRPE